MAISLSTLKIKNHETNVRLLHPYYKPSVVHIRLPESGTSDDELEVLDVKLIGFVLGSTSNISA